MTSDSASARLSAYSFPDELRVDELLLRPPTDDDVDIIAPAFADPAVGGEAGLPSFDADTIRRVMREQLPRMRMLGLLAPYTIEETRTDEILGGATLHHFDPMRDTVEVGYWLFVTARGRGFATRSVRAMMEHAFANGIYRVEAHVRIGNTASERVLERLGFTREGVKRRYLRDGQDGESRYDATLFSRLAND
jgi:RimJ/RimL family protein N-acetyltransferase